MFQDGLLKATKKVAEFDKKLRDSSLISSRESVKRAIFFDGFKPLNGLDDYLFSEKKEKK